MASKAFQTPNKEQIHGIQNITDHAKSTVVNENAEASIVLARNPDDGIESHIIFTEDAPPMKDFTDFFNHLPELVEYGETKMAEYLKHPTPQYLCRL